MNLSDIPAIRKQFQALDDEHEKARGECISRTNSVKRLSGSHTETALARIKDDWTRACKNYEDGMEELTYKLFGAYIGSTDPSDILDWIEHFLQEEA
jgi:hypothetical protein